MLPEPMLWMTVAVLGFIGLTVIAKPTARALARHWSLALLALVCAYLIWADAGMLALVLVAAFVLVKVRRHRRRTALTEGRALPAKVERAATRAAAPDLPREAVSGPAFTPAETYAVSRLLPAHWPAVAHGCGLSQRDHRMEAAPNSGFASGLAVLVSGLGALRDPGVIMEADRAFITPRLLGLPVPTPTGPQVRIALLPGQTPAAVASRAEALAAALRVPAVHALTTPTDEAEGAVTLSLRTREALAAAPTGRPAPALALAAVPYGLGEDGCPRTLSLANLSGIVGGGVPGSGKTASLNYILSALSQNPCVQFTVMDMKGGSDWQWIEPRAAHFTNEDEDFDSIAETVEQMHSIMRHRLSTQKDKYGSANFWNLDPNPEYPAMILVIDECQTVFESFGMSKEEKAKAEQIRRYVSALIKKGRSVGMVTILTTQKPTADALPTAIRDNCGLRLCWRVVTREAGEAVLGAIPAGTEILPTDIPASMPGVAVVASDRGGFERVRFGFISEGEAEALAGETSSLRRPLTDFLPAVPAEDSIEE